MGSGLDLELKDLLGIDWGGCKVGVFMHIHWEENCSFPCGHFLPSPFLGWLWQFLFEIE
jgi:hypothetical protein